jgi:hypothetical protein
MRKTTKIQPDREDFEAVAREYGIAHSDEEQVHHYRLAQVRKLCRDLGLEADLGLTAARRGRS